MFYLGLLLRAPPSCSFRRHLGEREGCVVDLETYKYLNSYFSIVMSSWCDTGGSKIINKTCQSIVDLAINPTPHIVAIGTVAIWLPFFVVQPD